LKSASTEYKPKVVFRDLEILKKGFFDKVYVLEPIGGFLATFQPSGFRYGNKGVESNIDDL